MTSISRLQALRVLEGIACQTQQLLISGDHSAAELCMLNRHQEHGLALAGTPFSSECAITKTKRLTMLWMAMDIIHSVLADGKKATQRELWYE